MADEKKPRKPRVMKPKAVVPAAPVKPEKKKRVMRPRVQAPAALEPKPQVKLIDIQFAPPAPKTWWQKLVSYIGW